MRQYMGDIYVMTWVTDRRRTVAIDHDGKLALWDERGEGEAAAKARPRRRRWHVAMRDHASARCVAEAGARAIGARVDSQNGCHHFPFASIHG